MTQASDILSDRDDFALIVLPDSQHYVEDEKYVENLPCFESQIQWIISHKERLNIAFVTHVGDHVQHDTSVSEFERASDLMKPLDPVVPYGFCAGNHDLHADGSARLFNRFFPVSRFVRRPYWVASFNGNRNNAQVFSAAEMDFVIVHVQFGPTDADLDWASDILKQHAEKRAIITTHMFLTVEEDSGITTRTSRLSIEHPGLHHEGENAGIDIFNRLVVPHDNVFMVLCGHYYAERHMTHRVGARRIFSMLADYNTAPYGGNGWLRLLRFSPQNNRIYVSTYSPYLEAFMKHERSEFELEYGMKY